MPIEGACSPGVFEKYEAAAKPETMITANMT
jgi:hypothetical protein